MLKLYSALKKPLHRRVLFALWFNNHTLSSLADKVRMDETSLQSVLGELDEDGVINLNAHYPETAVTLDPEIRQKISRTLSRFIITGIFVLVGFATTQADQIFSAHQSQRIRRRYQASRMDVEKYI